MAARAAAQAERNAMIRASLAERGDDGRRARQVSHYVFPAQSGDPAGDSAVKAAVAPDGYAARLTAAADGLILEKEREVASAAFEAEIVRLMTVMDGLGWYYDGWDCAVVPAK